MKENRRYLSSFYILNVLLASVVLVFTVSIEDQFALPKYVFLQVGTFILLSLWVFELFRFKHPLVQRTRVETLVLLYALVVFLSTISSLSPVFSLVGKYHRYEGMLTQVSYLVLFFLAVQLLKDPQSLWKHAKAMVLVATLVSLYGILQFVGWDVFSWSVSTGSLSGQALSTFGNRSFLGGFLVLALPLSLAWLCSVEGKERWVAGAAGVILGVGLVASETRASWIGALIGLAYFVLLNRKRVRLRWTILVAAVAALLVLMSFLSSGSLERLDRVAQRALAAVTFRGTSLAVRTEMWKAALKITASRPLLGTGPDAFILLFPRFQSLRYTRLGTWQSIADDPHNYFLSLSSTLGLSGLFVMSALLAAIVWKGTKAVMTGGELLYGGFLASTVSYLSHLTFSVGHLATNAWFWVILGLLSIRFFSAQAVRVSLSLRSRSAILALLALMTLGAAIFAGTRFLADFYFARAQRNTAVDSVERTVEDLDRAMRYAPYNLGYRNDLALLYIDLSDVRGDYSTLAEAATLASGSIDRNPYHIDGYMILASAYLRGAERFGEMRDSRLAEGVLTRSLDIKPNSALTHFFLARAALIQGKWTEARNHLKMALEIEPNYEDAKQLWREINQGQ